jgi:hypothetical protein
LRKIRPTDTIKSPAPHNREIGGVTALSPVVVNAAARETWEARIRESNTQFYVKEIPLRISFLTWNVASREPPKELVLDLAKAFRMPSSAVDIVVIGLEETDMSFKSVVTGNSSSAERWTELLGTAKMAVGDAQFDLVASCSMGGV